MFRPRLIPVLLLKNDGLVKSRKFKNYQYIGDPINAVRIFNDFKADELVFLDILATRENRLISMDFVRDVGEEANMPFAVGGGITTIDDIEKIIKAGAEKVIINQKAAESPEFIKEAADAFGSSTICICMDIRKKMIGGFKNYVQNGMKPTKYKSIDFARIAEENGAGELIVQSIDKDGMRNGYDIDLIRSIADSVSIPVVALGGAGNLLHMKSAYSEGYATGLAAGSFFVFHGKRHGVLITYPEKSEISF